MSNQFGNFATLSDPSGIFSDASSCQVTCVAIRSPLVGTLSLVGIGNVDGSASSWVIPSTTVGWVSPTGNSNGLANRLSFAYSNAADYGKAVVCFTPR